MLRKVIVSLAEGRAGRWDLLGKSCRSSQDLQQALCQYGEGGGTWRRPGAGSLALAEFQEKAQKIKNKVVSAMFYPIIVL